LSCLHQAIESPDVTAIKVLARTPSKLTDLLEKRNVTIPPKLKIIQGDAKSLKDAKECTQFTDVVVTGVGISPSSRHLSVPFLLRFLVDIAGQLNMGLGQLLIPGGITSLI
jgi:hypothetical protein